MKMFSTLDLYFLVCKESRGVLIPNQYFFEKNALKLMSYDILNNFSFDITWPKWQDPQIAELAIYLLT
jgi:hypothetical protein